MTVTKTNREFQRRRDEHRLSRIKLAKEFVLDHTTSSLCNNQKWHEIFEYLDETNTDFQLKMLLSSENRTFGQIRELEKTSVLVDDSADFIEFLEIDLIAIRRTKELTQFMDNLKVEYLDFQESIEIHGYVKK